jgi:hypothetical protein
MHGMKLVSSSAWVYLRTRPDRETGVSSPTSHRFDLSQLKALRSLEVARWASDFEPTRNTTVMEVLSTITSPVFSELVILTWGDIAARLPSEVRLFETLHAMNNVRPFKLVFLLMSSDSSLGEAQRELAEALDLVAARGLFDFLDSTPTIRCGRFRDGWDLSFD